MGQVRGGGGMGEKRFALLGEKSLTCAQISQKSTSPLTVTMNPPFDTPPKICYNGSTIKDRLTEEGIPN